MSGADMCLCLQLRFGQLTHCARIGQSELQHSSDVVDKAFGLG